MLCTAFGRVGAVAQVETLLHQWWDGQDDAADDTHIPAEERHMAVAEALGFPPYAYSMGYDAIEFGDAPKGVDLTLLTRLER